MATTEEDLTVETPVAGAPEATPAAGNAAGPSRGLLADVDAEDTEAFEPPSARLAVAVGFPTLGAAVMVGGVFKGVAPRPVAAIAGLLGVGLAFGVVRLRRRPILSNVVIVGGLFLIGVLMLAPSLGSVANLRNLVRDAAASGNVLRPPVDFVLGWKAILGWLLATVGFAAAWVTLALRKPALGLLVPLPLAGFAAISVPQNAQVASGLVVLVLFAVSLGILSSEQATADSDDESAKPPLAYEVRKVIKSVPIIAILVVALIFGQKYLTVLFPKPLIDPAQEPQKPKTQPLSEVEDRVLFEVESNLSGPWRIGSLDVYDGSDWRLAPFAQNELAEVPRSGIVDTQLQPALQARFTVAGLSGAVLPGLPNTTGIIAQGPKLAYDARSGSIRLVSGQVTTGLTYTVAAAALPSVDDLKAVTDPIPGPIRQFTKIPPPPPAVVDLLSRAASGRPTKWEQFDFARTFVLENVTAAGPGTPVSVTPDRVQDILAGSMRATPFEIVATQALLARWLGIPSRIGYGYDGGEQVDNKLQIRPRDGAAFPEVYFPGFKWLPVIGVPKKAEPTVGGDPSLQRVDPGILPSNDIAVQLFLPVLVPPKSVLSKQIAVGVLIAIPILLFLFLLYTLEPGLRKFRYRLRRRNAGLRRVARLRHRLRLRVPG